MIRERLLGDGPWPPGNEAVSAPGAAARGSGPTACGGRHRKLADDSLAASDGSTRQSCFWAIMNCLKYLPASSVKGVVARAVGRAARSVPR